MTDLRQTIEQRSADMLARAELFAAEGMHPVKAATLAAAAHYRDGLALAGLPVLPLLQHMTGMPDNCAKLPIDKISRWLGFCQAEVIQLCEKHRLLGLNVSIQTERDVTRPVFHWAYRRTGLEPPESVDVGDQQFALPSAGM